MNIWNRLIELFNSSTSNHEEMNIVDSIAKSKILYKKLISITHPDRNPTQEELAKVLSERINANRYNYRELKNIEQEVYKKLLKP
ncbi:hypothetical protein HMPREF9447_03814 [Bacteroides oleiciplenus YIT 12058]|uniref:J domain-containing protein n=2 Tax=Bacteroides oleiciplenus TaxID=626931 RepID=K9EIJ2_9BACE|nr:hypothetical protein HMPREF9447_03814 [Bacteroides oleiciplenus YIT 12058]